MGWGFEHNLLFPLAPTSLSLCICLSVWSSSIDVASETANEAAAWAAEAGANAAVSPQPPNPSERTSLPQETARAASPPSLSAAGEGAAATATSPLLRQQPQQQQRQGAGPPGYNTSETGTGRIATIAKGGGFSRSPSEAALANSSNTDIADDHANVSASEGKTGRQPTSVDVTWGRAARDWERVAYGDVYHSRWWWWWCDSPRPTQQDSLT